MYEKGAKSHWCVSLSRDGGCLRPSIFSDGLRLPFQISERLTRAGNELLPLRGGIEEKERKAGAETGNVKA